MLGGGESEGLVSTGRRGEGPLLVEDEEGSGAGGHVDQSGGSRWRRESLKERLAVAMKGG